MTDNREENELSEERLSRRAVVPGLAVGATAALAGVLAAAAPPAAASHLPVIIERTQHAGPCPLWREQALHVSAFQPAVAARLPALRFRLTIQTLEGRVLALREFALAPGTGAHFLLAADADGTILFNGTPTGAVVPDVGFVSIIAILIGLRTAGHPETIASLISVSTGPDAEPGKANYLLPLALSEANLPSVR